MFQRFAGVVVSCEHSRDLLFALRVPDLSDGRLVSVPFYQKVLIRHRSNSGLMGYQNGPASSRQFPQFLSGKKGGPASKPGFDLIKDQCSRELFIAERELEGYQYPAKLAA